MSCGFAGPVRRVCRKPAFPKSDIRIAAHTGATAEELSFGTVIVGGGPAALAPLISASRDGRLDEFLAGGVAIVERGPTIGSGQLGDYGIASDSTAETFMTAVLGHADPRLGVLSHHPLCRELRAVGPGPVPLVKAAALMGMIGSILHQAVVEAGGVVMLGHEALSARQGSDGRWRTSVRRLEDGFCRRASLRRPGSCDWRSSGGRTFVARRRRGQTACPDLCGKGGSVG